MSRGATNRTGTVIRKVLYWWFFLIQYGLGNLWVKLDPGTTFLVSIPVCSHIF